jgi:chromosome segregation ATPase
MSTWESEASRADALAKRVIEQDAELTRLNARVAEMEASLKSVLDRETATIQRYDAKLESAERERDEARRECERLRGAASAAIKGLREWYGQDFDRAGNLDDTPEVERLIAALTDQATSQPKEPT